MLGDSRGSYAPVPSKPAHYLDDVQLDIASPLSSARYHHDDQTAIPFDDEELDLKQWMSQRRLLVRVIEAKNLLGGLDEAGQAEHNGYATLRLHETEYWTKTLFANVNPDWNAEFSFPVQGELTGDLTDNVRVELHHQIGDGQQPQVDPLLADLFVSLEGMQPNMVYRSWYAMQLPAGRIRNTMDTEDIHLELFLLDLPALLDVEVDKQLRPLRGEHEEVCRRFREDLERLVLEHSKEREKFQAQAREERQRLQAAKEEAEALVQRERENWERTVATTREETERSLLELHERELARAREESEQEVVKAKAEAVRMLKSKQEDLEKQAKEESQRLREMNLQLESKISQLEARTTMQMREMQNKDSTIAQLQQAARSLPPPQQQQKNRACPCCTIQ
eukprot:tig00000144_g9075.t1